MLGLRYLRKHAFDMAQTISELEPQMEIVREQARKKALEGIKTAGEKDWRALAEWSKLTFPEYRQGNNINVNATPVNDQRTVVVTEQKRAELQAKLKSIQAKLWTEAELIGLGILSDTRNFSVDTASDNPQSPHRSYQRT